MKNRERLPSRRRCASMILAVLRVLWLGRAEAQGKEGEGAGPQISLPPWDGPRAGIPRPAALQLPREQNIDVPLSQPATLGTAIGGYGELVLNSPSNGDTIIDLRRLVLYVGHNFTDRLRLYTELEVEHAVTSANDKGEFEVEQAFLDYLGWRPLNFRAGVILMPVGIINVFHEPPSFNGADRPDTDRLIIPTTWREPGAGLFGAYGWLRYQLYVVNGFNATGFSAASGLRDGHQEAQLALGHDWGAVGRVDLLPVLGTDVGASFYYANADQGQAVFKGDRISVGLVEADARWRWRGLEARGEVASVWIGGTDRLNQVLAAGRQLDQPPQGPVARQLLGGYVEVGYDVLHPAGLRSGMTLLPFLRYEHSDTQYRLSAGLARALGNQRDTLTAGLTFRPIAEVALKFDYQRSYTDSQVAGDDTIDRWNAALGFMF